LFENDKLAAVVTLEKMHAAVLLLFSKIRHDVGSTSGRYAAHPLSASVSDLVGPTDRLSKAV
jgi:hypothetical protein